MSELAFDCNGEPFIFHRRTKRLRVRFFRNPGMRGAPEVVNDEQGGQLYVPPTNSFLEFRHRVREPGRYRLDQCDEDGAPILSPGGEPVPAAYVTIVDPRRNVAGSGAGGSGQGELERVIGVLAEALGSTQRTMAENYAEVTAQNHELIRAVTGLLGVAAGLPRPDPTLASVRNAADTGDAKADSGEEEDDDDEEEDDGPEDTQTAAQKMTADLIAALTKDLPASLVHDLLPLVKAWVFRKWREKASATSSPPAAAQAPGSSTTAHAASSSATDEPARAAAGASSTYETSTAASATGTTATSAPTSASPAASDVVPPGASADTRATAPSGSDIRNTGEPTPAQMEHLFAISDRLAPREATIAQEAVLRMTPAQRATWLAELSVLTLDQAVALVRSMIPPQPGATPSVAPPSTDDALPERSNG